jgi:hypothetical protein
MCCPFWRKTVGRSKLISFGVGMEVDGGLEQTSANSGGKPKWL